MTEEAAPPPAPEAPTTPDTAGQAPPSAPAETKPAWKPNYGFLAGVSIATLAADLGTKQWAKMRLGDENPFSTRRIDVIHGLFSLRFARNLGGAWGLLQDEPESVRRPFFLGISVLAIVFIVSLYRKLTPQQTALKWGLPLVLGGALGNLVNRIQFNYVVDFLDVWAKWGGHEHHWPTFNVADIAIVVGVALMAIDMFTPRRVSTSTTVPRPSAAREPLVSMGPQAAPNPGPDEPALITPLPPPADPAPAGEAAPKET
jgi:signal peptidase II